MTNLTKRRERYLKDSLPIRLGGIAANLARIGSTASNPSNGEAVRSMLYESKHFIEWTAADFPSEIAGELVDLQIELAVRQSRWEKEIPQESDRIDIGHWARQRSQTVLQHSGLLDK